MLIENKMDFFFDPKNRQGEVNSGAPNENIFQNYLNIALLNVFWDLNVDMGIFLSPKNFSSVRIS